MAHAVGDKLQCVYGAGEIVAVRADGVVVLQLAWGLAYLSTEEVARSTRYL